MSDITDTGSTTVPRNTPEHSQHSTPLPLTPHSRSQVHAQPDVVLGVAEHSRGGQDHPEEATGHVPDPDP